MTPPLTTMASVLETAPRAMSCAPAMCRLVHRNEPMRRVGHVGRAAWTTLAARPGRR